MFILQGLETSSTELPSHVEYRFRSLGVTSSILHDDFSSLSVKLRGGSMGRVQGVRTPPPEMTRGLTNTTGILPKKTMWFIGVEVEQETSAPPPKKNPESAHEAVGCLLSAKFVSTSSM